MNNQAPPSEPLSYAEARHNAELIARSRRTAVDQLQKAAQALADAEVAYHRRKAERMAQMSTEGVGVTEAQERIKGEPTVADALHERENAKVKQMIAAERLASIDGERASFHRLAEWSRQLDNVLGGHPQ